MGNSVDPTPRQLAAPGPCLGALAPAGWHGAALHSRSVRSSCSLSGALLLSFLGQIVCSGDSWRVRGSGNLRKANLLVCLNVVRIGHARVELLNLFENLAVVLSQGAECNLLQSLSCPHRDFHGLWLVVRRGLDECAGSALRCDSPR
jgi:hypothetical protein